MTVRNALPFPSGVVTLTSTSVLPLVPKSAEVITEKTAISFLVTTSVSGGLTIAPPEKLAAVVS